MQVPPRCRSLPAALLFLATFAIAPADFAVAAERAWVEVPPGNRSPLQPEVSTSSVARTAETKSDFETKYRAIRDRLAAEPELIAKIEAVAAVYDIDPIHMIGAIVGEHTYNVDIFDNLQGYYVKALSYLTADGLTFGHAGESIEAFVARPEFAGCDEADGDYAVWSCRDRVWRTVFRGRTVDGKAFPDDRFERVFFQPFFAGQTFGLGQLNPLAALMVSDMVEAKGDLPALDMRAAPEVYRAVMDPDMTLHYMAATIANDIAVYRDVAHFDIAGNPGLTATLYNLGQAGERAASLAAENARRLAAGEPLLLPQENYYGWLVNARLAELRALLTPADEPAVVEVVEEKPAAPVDAVEEPAAEDVAAEPLRGTLEESESKPEPAAEEETAAAPEPDEPGMTVIP